jgi:hypothetical protein
LYIEKRRVEVRISQIGHDPTDGFLCLALASNTRGEPRTLLELLNSDLRVIPFLLEEDGAVILLTRLNLDWIVVGERVQPELIFPAHTLTSREEPVALHFLNGTTIDGLIQIDQPLAGGRISDFLNSPADFYPVRTRLGTLLVNKSRVKETRLSTASPHWAVTPVSTGGAASTNVS